MTKVASPVGVAVALVVLVAAAPASAGYRGRPVTDVLEELRNRGLSLMFSTAVVPPDLMVPVEPEGNDPRQILDQILASVGLKAEPGALGTILIVRGPPPSEKPVEAHMVERIVVTPPHKTAVPQLGTVRSLDGDDLNAMPALGSDPTRAVGYLPGVAATDASAEFHARGGVSRDVSMVLDGLELYEPYHLSAMQNPFSFVDGRIVDSVDFVDGGFTADRGDRLGGFLQISSVSAAKAASTQLEAGSLSSRISYATPTPLGSLLVSGRYGYPEVVDGTIAFAGDGYHPRFGDLYVKLGLLSTPRTEISGHLLVAADRANLGGPEPSANEHLDSSNRSGYLWFRALRTWSPAVTTDTIVSTGTLDRSRSGIAEPEAALLALDEKRDVEFIGLRNDATWTLGRGHIVRGGLDVQFQETDLSYAFGSPGAATATAVSRSGSSIGAYAAYRAAIGSRLVAETGLRWDRQTYTGDSRWSPRLNVVWSASERNEFRAGIGRYTQSLRIHELRIEDGETTYGPPEVARQLDLGFAHRFERPWSLRVDAYRHDIEHLQPRYESLYHPVELFPELAPDRVRIAAQGATLQGVELTARGELARPLDWSVSYTWSSAMDRIAGVDVPRSWDQTHAATVLIGYRWQRGWFLSFSGVVHTGWPTTPELGARNSDRLPAYARLDLRAGRTLDTRKGNVRFELTVLNATDRKNACCVEEFRPSDTSGGATTPVYDYWMGITPSLLVLWTF